MLASIRFRSFIATTAMASFLTACSDKEFSLPWEPAGGRANLAGPAQMLEPNIEAFDNNQLASLLDPAGFRGNEELIRGMSTQGILKASEVLKAENKLAAAKKELEKAEKALVVADANVASAIAASGIAEHIELRNRLKSDLKNLKIQITADTKDLNLWKIGLDPKNPTSNVDDSTRNAKIAEIDGRL